MIWLPTAIQQSGPTPGCQLLSSRVVPRLCADIASTIIYCQLLSSRMVLSGGRCVTEYPTRYPAEGVLPSIPPLSSGMCVTEYPTRYPAGGIPTPFATPLISSAVTSVIPLDRYPTAGVILIQSSRVTHPLSRGRDTPRPSRHRHPAVPILA